jgi:D-serine deaminase-like pyridoxal phosphate-dependent protein
LKPTDYSSLVGQPIDALTTPALVVDADLLEANLRLLADYFADRICRIRPHFKSHKCVELARRQLAAGRCSGVTCAKLSEAEKLAEGGLDDILVANQVVGPAKARRLAELNKTALVRCAIDAREQIVELNEAALDAGVTIPVFIEVDVGMKRCGVPPGDPAVELAKRVADAEGLRFDGLQGFEGHMVYVVDKDERDEETRASLERLVETRYAIEEAGLGPCMVSSGGTGTYDLTGNMAGIDEVQCGTYALMDGKYNKVRPEFRIARWVLATIISAHDDFVVVDVGLKGIGCDMGSPLIEGHPEALARYTAEEHVPIDHMTGKVGDQLRLVPLHGCTTHHLHRRMWITRNGVIEDAWDIEGAGCLE